MLAHLAPRLLAPALLLLLALLPAPARAARHLAVLVGANTGWTQQDRPLRHAEEDARRLGAVLAELGDFAPADIVLLSDPTPAGAQRPAFRNELKGQGELFLTRLQGPVARLRFPADGRRCFLTDISERRLVAEVYPQKQRPVQLAVPAGVCCSSAWSPRATAWPRCSRTGARRSTSPPSRL